MQAGRTAESPPAHDQPTSDEISVALERILRSDIFRKSPQLASFLRFVVETTLSGHRDRIKAYTIAVEALGRPDSFDPQIDPIVRGEAARLRRALARYYAESGAADPVVITLPSGRYVPVFRAAATPSKFDFLRRLWRAIRRSGPPTER